MEGRVVLDRVRSQYPEAKSAARRLLASDRLIRRCTDSNDG